MECITIYKKDLKYYMFVLYVIHNFRHKGINVVSNEVIADDLRDMISPTGTQIFLKDLWVPAEEIQVSESLYVSKGLSEYVKYFKDEKLLYNFNKFILVADFEKLKYVTSKL